MSLQCAMIRDFSILEEPTLEFLTKYKQKVSKS